MNNIFKIVILLLSLTLIQCSSDDSNESGRLLVNGEEFKLGTALVEDGSNLILFTLVEKTPIAYNNRIIQVVAMHPDGTATGTYQLRSNIIETGIANIGIYDSELEQLAGGSVNQPTGTLTVTHIDGKKYKLVFNDVTLDPNTATETTISGSCLKTFSSGNSD